MDISSSRLFSTFGKKIVPYVAPQRGPLVAPTPAQWPTQPFAPAQPGLAPPPPTFRPIDTLANAPRRRQPIRHPASRSLPQATPTGQKIINLATQVHTEYPNLHKEAATFIHNEIKNKLGKDVDPDAYYLDRFGTAHSDSRAFSGWAHNQAPLSSMTLTEAVYANYRAYDQANADVLDAYGAGIYRDGADAETYGSQNELKVLPTQLMNLIWQGDFNDRYRARLENFWSKHIDDFRTLAKTQFIANLFRQQANGSLDTYNYRLVLDSMGAERLPTPVSEKLLHSRKTVTTRGVYVRKFDINGYDSTDILHFKRDGNPRVVLYIPGDIPAFKSFRNESQLNTWIMSTSPEDPQRNALAAHFSLYDRQDGAKPFGRYGVDHVLKHLAENNSGWGRRHINYNHSSGSSEISGDLFTHLASAIKDRDLLDAGTRITSNSEINRDIWLSYLKAFNSLTLAGAPMFAPVNMILAAGSVARIALGADKALSGDTAADRSDGLGHVLGGALELSNAVSLNTGANGTAQSTDLIEAVANPGPEILIPTEPNDLLDTALRLKTNLLDWMDWRITVAEQNEGVAREVFTEVREAYQLGLKSGNKVYIDVPKAIIYEGRDVAANAAIKEARRIRLLGDPAAAAVEKSSDELRIEAANCGDLSQISAKLAMEAGVNAEQWSIEGADHSFTVIGKPPPGPTVDFSNWEGIWIIDPWANIVCPAKRYVPKLLERMKKWQADGKHITDGLRTFEAAEPKWLKGLAENPKVVVRKPTEANPMPWQSYHIR